MLKISQKTITPCYLDLIHITFGEINEISIAYEKSNITFYAHFHKGIYFVRMNEDHVRKLIIQ